MYTYACNNIVSWFYGTLNFLHARNLRLISFCVLRNADEESSESVDVYRTLYYIGNLIEQLVLPRGFTDRLTRGRDGGRGIKDFAINRTRILHLYSNAPVQIRAYRNSLQKCFGVRMRSAHRGGAAEENLRYTIIIFVGTLCIT